MLYLSSSWTLLLVHLHAADFNLGADGGGCNPGDDPCFECFSCNEYGRCLPVDGCVPSCYSDDDCTRNQICNDNVCGLPGGAPKDDPNRSGGRKGSGSKSGSKGSGSDRGSDRGDRSSGSGNGDSSNPMGSCQYDGSLGHSESALYESECLRLSMAECMTTGPRGRCTYVVAEDSHIGCVWDGSGCANGCDPGNMESRCGTLSHDQSACEGADGSDYHCKWSRAGAHDHDQEQGLFDKVGMFKVDDLSSKDVVVVVVLAVSVLAALYQLYRWCVNWKLHREYKLVNTSDPERERTARSSHCIIDGKAYF